METNKQKKITPANMLPQLVSLRTNSHGSDLARTLISLKRHAHDGMSRPSPYFSLWMEKPGKATVLIVNVSHAVPITWSCDMSVPR